METPLWAQDLENLGGLWKESEGMLAYTVYVPLSLDRLRCSSSNRGRG